MKTYWVMWILVINGWNDVVDMKKTDSQFPSKEACQQAIPTGREWNFTCLPEKGVEKP